MKKTVFALLSGITFLFSSCNQAELDQLKSEKTQLENKVSLLEDQSALKDSTISDFFNSFNEIESNLALIREKEKNIVSQKVSGEVRKDVKEQIISDITDINDLLQENKQKIGQLSKNLKNANINISKFEEMITLLEEKIDSKDGEITTLRTNLANANSALSALNDLYIEQVLETEAKVEELNTAYYAFGTFKELKESNVVGKEGGIVGLGSAKTLKKDFNKSYFKKIDINEKTAIAIYSDKAKLVTSHPSDSYTLALKDGQYEIDIKDPKAFWSASKYLVIITD